MNKWILVIIGLFFFENLLYAQRPIRRTAKSKCVYYEYPKLKESAFWMLRHCNQKKAHMVRDAESAAMIAYVYASNIYGKDIAKMEQPYSVTNLNDSLWIVGGKSVKRNKKKPWKGSFSFLIDSSGHILFYMHEK